MRRAASIAALLSLTLLAGCGERGGSTSAPAEPAATASTASSPPPAPLPYDRLEEPRCDPAETNCTEARGEIGYAERLDPDGDGDAHFVLLSADGVTAPGITVVDVAAELRPAPLPRPGDLLAAAGPVYSGSFGQRQIQATAIDFVRVREGG